MDSAECLSALCPTLGHCAHLARERMDARLAGSDGTPAQTHVLLYLHRHGGSAPQAEITAYLRVRPSTANGILDRMEVKGLIRRSVSGSDGRQKLISVTQRGTEQYARVRGAFSEMEEVAARGFSGEERAALLSMLRRVIQNLEEDRAR